MYERAHNSQRKRRLQTIKCECGAEILMLPDVKEMSKAIDSHVQEHCRKLEPADAKVESERLWDLLVASLLEQASYPAKAVC